MADAKTAGLVGKQGPWSQYPKRMRQMRARGFALRDMFADVLRGMPVAEDLQDMPTEPMRGTAQAVPQHIEAPDARPAHPPVQLAENLPDWRQARLDG